MLLSLHEGICPPQDYRVEKKRIGARRHRREESKMTTAFASLFLIGMPGIPEMLVIGGVIVLLFGATKLPKLGKGLGEGIRNFKTGLTGSKEKKGDQDGGDEKALSKTDDSNSDK